MAQKATITAINHIKTENGWQNFQIFFSNGESGTASYPEGKDYPRKLGDEVSYTLKTTDYGNKIAFEKKESSYSKGGGSYKFNPKTHALQAAVNLVAGLTEPVDGTLIPGYAESALKIAKIFEGYLTPDQTTAPVTEGTYIQPQQPTAQPIPQQPPAQSEAITPQTVDGQVKKLPF